MEEAPGLVDPLPNPEVYIDTDPGICGQFNQKTVAACAGVSGISLITPRWQDDHVTDRMAPGYRVLAHEYLHVLYYRFGNVEDHHAHWEQNMNAHHECNYMIRRNINE